MLPHLIISLRTPRYDASAPNAWSSLPAASPVFKAEDDEISDKAAFILSIQGPAIAVIVARVFGVKRSAIETLAAPSATCLITSGLLVFNAASIV